MNAAVPGPDGLKAPRIFLHAGVPRTATTVLQRSVFPRLATIRYLGKNADNTIMRGDFQPFELIEQACAQVVSGQGDGVAVIRMVLPKVVIILKKHDQSPGTGGDEEAARVAGIFARCLATVGSRLPDRSVLYSDESLVESISGLSANPGFGDSVPLERLHATGLLDHVTLSVVLRAPDEFLKASFYKTMELRKDRREPALSFDEYIKRQLLIHERSPTASRIFLCRHRTAKRHFERLCPRTVVTHYRDLVAAPHVLDTLLGCETGEEPVSLSSLPRENNTWRDSAANAYILGAEGVPRGLASVEAYAATFPETLARYGLEQLFAGEDL